jgi:16S rRNA (cytosine967-C5)-methyltransferase
MSIPAVKRAAAKLPPADEPAGRASRRLAVHTVHAVLTQKRALDDAFNEGVTRLGLHTLEPRDRAFARLIATVTLRHLGRLEAVVMHFVGKPFPDDIGRLKSMLSTTAAQLLLLNTPPHAAISQAVDIAKLDRYARRFDKLVNAVLRKVATEGPALLATLDGVRLDTPDWLWNRWTASYGDSAARAIATACLVEAPLDISVKSDPAHWATMLSGTALPTGSIRVREAGRIEDLPGYTDGAWWVQDAAAALPVRLLGDINGKWVADLCAAPGGKTAQLASAGAKVVAVDASGKRLERLRANLARLGLEVEREEADVADFAAIPANAGVFQAVLLDAPCSAIGTIRRHPDLLRTKDEGEIARLAARQTTLLAAAAQLVGSGGTLVYATCSLEPEEGEHIVDAFLASGAPFDLVPVDPSTVPPGLITARGHLRTFPQASLGSDPIAVGMDAFFAARLVRR